MKFPWVALMIPIISKSSIKPITWGHKTIDRYKADKSAIYLAINSTVTSYQFYYLLNSILVFRYTYLQVSKYGLPVNEDYQNMLVEFKSAYRRKRHRILFIII